jgi:hypothetical protein
MLKIGASGHAAHECRRTAQQACGHPDLTSKLACRLAAVLCAATREEIRLQHVKLLNGAYT